MKKHRLGMLAASVLLMTAWSAESDAGEIEQLNGETAITWQSTTENSREEKKEEIVEESEIQEKIQDLTIRLPLKWRGQYHTERNGNTVWFVHDASRTAGRTGYLFGIGIYGGDSWKGQSQAEVLGSKNGWTYLWVTPEEIQYTSQTFGSYQALSLASSQIKNEMIPNLLPVLDLQTASSAYYSGWLITREGTYYYRNGDVVKGLQFIDGYVYYFHPTTGCMYTAWAKVGGKWNYFGTDGKRCYGFYLISHKVYYFDQSNGEMAVGWKKVDGNWFYFNEYGSMCTGWRKVNGCWYYLNRNGAMLKGFQPINNAVYYMNPSSGAMATGWKKVDGNWFYFNSGGVMQYGFRYLNHIVYYLDETTGAMATGKVWIHGKTYAFSTSGARLYGIQVFNSKRYYFDKATGAMRVSMSWKEGGVEYRCDANGVLTIK